jgi:hypothetical protein
MADRLHPPDRRLIAMGGSVGRAGALGAGFLELCRAQVRDYP